MSEADLTDDADTYDLRVADHVTWNDVDADLVVFNRQDGTYHAFDRVGSDVWRAVARRGRFSTIVADLRQRYLDDADAIAEDVRGFVNHIVRLGLLVVRKP
jgi:hypothetical protein